MPFGMTLGDLERLISIFSDTKHCMVSLQQLSFLFSVLCVVSCSTSQWSLCDVISVARVDWSRSWTTWRSRMTGWTKSCRNEFRSWWRAGRKRSATTSQIIYQLEAVVSAGSEVLVMQQMYVIMKLDNNNNNNYYYCCH